MRGVLSRISGSASAVLAVLIVLLVAFVLFATLGLTSGGVEVLNPPRISDAELRALAPGTTRSEVERRFGDGQDALEYQETGAAVEPLDAECLYYAQAGAEDIRDFVQLCFLDGKLSSKRKFDTPPGPPLF